MLLFCTPFPGTIRSWCSPFLCLLFKYNIKKLNTKGAVLWQISLDVNTEVKPSPCSHLSVIMRHSRSLQKLLHNKLCSPTVLNEKQFWFYIYWMHFVATNLCKLRKCIHSFERTPCPFFHFSQLLNAWCSICCIVLHARYSRQELCLHRYLQSN